MRLGTVVDPVVLGVWPVSDAPVMLRRRSPAEGLPTLARGTTIRTSLPEIEPCASWSFR